MKMSSRDKSFLGVLTLFVLFLSRSAWSKSARNLHYILCKQREGITNVMAEVPVVSKLDCARQCASLLLCQSGSYCKLRVTNVTLCSLSTDQHSDCHALSSSDDECLTFSMIERCQNGGHYNKMKSTCDCTDGWKGPVCEQVASQFTTSTSPVNAITSETLWLATSAQKSDYPTMTSAATTTSTMGAMPSANTWPAFSYTSYPPTFPPSPTTISTTTATTTKMTTKNPNDCDQGDAVCSGAPSRVRDNNNELHCCQSGSISSSTSNGVFTCTCG